jgi:hypothetical protein
MYTATDLSPPSISRRHRKQLIGCIVPPNVTAPNYCQPVVCNPTSKYKDSPAFAYWSCLLAHASLASFRFRVEPQSKICGPA